VHATRSGPLRGELANVIDRIEADLEPPFPPSYIQSLSKKAKILSRRLSGDAGQPLVSVSCYLGGRQCLRLHLRDRMPQHLVDTVGFNGRGLLKGCDCLPILPQEIAKCPYVGVPSDGKRFALIEATFDIPCPRLCVFAIDEALGNMGVPLPSNRNLPFAVPLSQSRHSCLAVTTA